MAIAALRRTSNAFRENAAKLATQLTAKTYEYTFNNELPKSVRILLEEDPEGMLQAARQEIDTGIPVVGERAKRHEKELKEAYARIVNTAKPFQEYVVINEQVKTVSMRSPMVLCSIAICEWNGALKIVMVKTKIMSTSLPMCINKLQDNDSKATLIRADSLEQALESFGLQIGFDKQTSATAGSEVEVSGVQLPSNREGQLAQQADAKQMPWQLQPPTLLQTSHTAQSQTLHKTPMQTQQVARQAQNLPPQMQQHTPRHRLLQMQSQTPGQSPRQGPHASIPAGDMALLYGRGSHSGKVQVALHSREAEKPSSSPQGPPLPDGFLPVEGDVMVYSVSQKQWVAGKLRGLSLGKPSSSPAGSVYVEYVGGLKQMTQKVILAKQLPDMLRT